MPYRALASACLLLSLLGASGATAQSDAELLRQPTPVRQSSLTPETAGPPEPVSLRDASRDDRWLGLGVRDVRWAPDGSRVYFRWHDEPEPGQDPDADPWFAVDREGRTVREVPVAERGAIPGDEVVWSEDRRRAAWVRNGTLYLYEGGAPADSRTRPVFRGAEAPEDVRFRGNGVRFTLGQDLYRYAPDTGAVRRLTRRYVRHDDPREADRWLEDEQLRLFEHLRDRRQREEAAEARERRGPPELPQPIPVAEGDRLENLRLSPDGRWLTFRVRTPAPDDASTEYMDYVTESGHAEALGGRSGRGASLVGSATAPAPRRRAEGIALSYVEVRQHRRWGRAAPTRRAEGGRGLIRCQDSSAMYKTSQSSPFRV